MQKFWPVELHRGQVTHVATVALVVVKHHCLATRTRKLLTWLILDTKERNTAGWIGMWLKINTWNYRPIQHASRVYKWRAPSSIIDSMSFVDDPIETWWNYSRFRFRGAWCGKLFWWKKIGQQREIDSHALKNEVSFETIVGVTCMYIYIYIYTYLCVCILYLASGCFTYLWRITIVNM